MNIAIAGYGVEGKSSYTYFLSRGHSVTILDEHSEITSLPAGAQAVLGSDAFAKLDAYDMVVRTPSLPPRQLQAAKKVWSATNEFFAQCPVPIIGVTGTKGKGTTCSFIAAILRQAGKKVHLVGNIGAPALDILPEITENDVVVYEMSSFQLWDLEKSPHVAVILMIEPDHLDIHVSFDEYIAAKQNIVRFQTPEGITIFNTENTYSSKIAAISSAVKVPVPAEETVHIKDEYFWHGGEKLCAVSSVRLPGRHNLNNACAAIAAAWPYVQDPEVIERGLGDFNGLPHRLKFVREVGGAMYYDDSIATTVGSAVAAMKAFKQPKVIILGGASKGIIDFETVASTAAQTGVKNAILIGGQASKIQEVLEKYDISYVNMGSSTTMKKVVQKAHELAAPGDVVILSPAYASYDMFKNYADRGDQFMQAVNEL